MKRPALKILEQRAALAGLTNVSTYHGMIEQYTVGTGCMYTVHIQYPGVSSQRSSRRAHMHVQTNAPQSILITCVSICVTYRCLTLYRRFTGRPSFDFPRPWSQSEHPLGVLMGIVLMAWSVRVFIRACAYLCVCSCMCVIMHVCVSMCAGASGCCIGAPRVR